MRPRSRGTRTTRPPKVRPAPWKARGWQDAPNAGRPAPADASPWADVVDLFAELLREHRVVGVSGQHGTWALTLPSGRVLHVVADERSVEEMRILR